MSDRIRIDMTSEQFRALLKSCADHLGDPEWALLDQILMTKLNRMLDHALYSESKTLPTPEQREQARQKYLDRKGVPADFRW